MYFLFSTLSVSYLLLAIILGAIMFIGSLTKLKRVLSANLVVGPSLYLYQRPRTLSLLSL